MQKYRAIVYYITEEEIQLFLGETFVSAKNKQEARNIAINELWDKRLTCASCRVKVDIIG